MKRAAFAAALALPLTAATPEPVSLAWLHGEWAGNGQMFGRKSEVTIVAAPALGGSATELRYVAQVAASGEAPAFRFEGQGIYRVNAKGKVEGRWSDSNGSFHPVGGRVNGRRMETLWGQTTTEIGRSSYTLDDAGQFAVSDAVLTPDGTWRIFATATYRRGN
jgi:hypothetical protein